MYNVSMTKIIQRNITLLTLLTAFASIAEAAHSNWPFLPLQTPVVPPEQHKHRLFESTLTSLADLETDRQNRYWPVYFDGNRRRLVLNQILGGKLHRESAPPMYPEQVYIFTKSQDSEKQYDEPEKIALSELIEAMNPMSTATPNITVSEIIKSLSGHKLVDKHGTAVTLDDLTSLKDAGIDLRFELLSGTTRLSTPLDDDVI